MGSEASSQAELDRLAEEFVDRTRRGEGPTISSYVREHPDLADDINRLFPLLQALEHVEPEAPTQLGDYRIVREVGRGGMGVVYEAVQEPLGRRVALKILPKHMTLDARLLDRFRLEAQAAARLQHRHIVPVIGWGQHEGVYYYTMQFVDGAGLDAVDELPGEGTHYERAARAVLQASEGVAAAHARGVLHRDIKPSNLMLDEKGAVWVTDFGLCKEVESEGVTQPHDLLGTLRYMAPERFKGVSDVQGDVYGLGLTLYELLTREPAYQGEDHAALAARIAESGPPRPRKLDPHIPPDLELIVLKAIHRDRAQRYATVDALAADLRAYLDRRPVTARAPTVGYLLRSFVRRHKAITAIGCAAILAIVLSTTFYVVSLRDKESTARFRQYIANVAAAETALRDRDVPVAERLLAEAPAEFRNWEWRHLSSQLDRSTRSFPRWRWNVSYVAYAPSGHWVASVAAGQTRMVDADSGETEAEIEHRSHVQDMAWHPTGLFWAVGTPMGVEVWSWPEPQRIIDEPVGDVRAIAFSKDGT
ncbi:MAG: serine/threonine-protein kinase, partial [Planctomycetota bacterium]|nr:serine/threonine-protein kinase [Planctomycetota bacterium]